MYTLVVLSSLLVAATAQLYPFNNAYWAHGHYNTLPYNFYNYNTHALKKPVTYSTAHTHVAPAHHAVYSHALPYSAVNTHVATPYSTVHTHVATPYAHAATPYSHQHSVARSYAAYTPYVSPVQHSSQYHAQDDLGQYTYGYSAGPSSKHETKRFDGATVGSYSYIDANNKVQTVSYTADDVHGFRVAATNLPVASAEGPQPVQDTPEVAAAKVEFQQLFDEAAAAADAAGESEEQAEEETEVVALKSPEPVMDTPEVAAAKIEFQQLYDEAAAAADAAPDHSHYRRRRSALLVPSVAKATYKTVSLIAADEEPTPADTTLLKLKKQEHEVYVPAPVHYAVPHLVHPAPLAYAHRPAVEVKSVHVKQVAHPLFYNHAALPLVYNYHH